MPFQVSPGVSVREIDLTTTIPSVSTTDGGTVIDAQWGPAEVVMLVSSEQDLISLFGRPTSNSQDTTQESWLSAAQFLKYSNKLRVVRANNSSNNAASGADAPKINHHNQFNESYAKKAGVKWVARYPGVLGNSLKVSMATGAAAYSNAAANYANASYKGGPIVTGQTSFNFGGDYATASAMDKGAIKVGDIISFPAQTYPSQTYRVTALAAGPDNYGNTVTVFPGLVENITDTAAIKREWEYARYFDAAPTTTTWGKGFNVDGVNNVVADALHIAIVDEDGGITGTKDTVLELHTGLSKAKNATDPETGRRLYYADSINERSAWVYWGDTVHPGGNTTEWGTTVNAAAVEFGIEPNSNAESLTGASSGSATDGGKKLAYDLYRNTEDIDLSVIFTGDASATVSKHVIENIAEARKDCIVCVSPERADVVPTGYNSVEQVLGNVLDWRNNVLGVSSSYAMADSGWKYIHDKYTDAFRWIPLNADVAGCIVRTDTERDPWFSPAGYNRGQIKNVVKLAWSPNKAQRDDLYRAEVNPVVTFPGRGTVLFGDKTLYGRNSAFDRVNVRRLFIVLEKAISTAAKFLLFEFNDEFTRAQFRNMVEPFLRDIKGRRGITDFKVICDDSNNPGSVIDRNEFVGDIYIKPARSINYIQLNFVAASTGVEFSEIVGAI